MSTPGSDGPQPPEQTPSQSGPQAGGGQPPADRPGQDWTAPQQPGQQQPGAQQNWAAPQQNGAVPQQPGQNWAAPQQNGAVPQQPGQPWGAPPPQGAFGAPQPGGAQAFGQPEKPKRKILPIIGGLVALVVVLGALSAFLGGGDPEVGDCVKPDGTSFETVDCGDDEAQAKIVGTDDDMTGDEFDATDPNELCTEVPSSTVVLWSGTSNDEDGKVYCAEDL